MERILAVLSVIIMLYGCSADKDSYLRSLKIEEVQLSPYDVISLEDYDLYSPSKVERFGDWFVVSDDKSEYAVHLINPDTKEHIKILRKGRGPGELIGSGSLHKYNGNVRVYDRGKDILLSVDIRNSIAQKRAVLDTICIFSKEFATPSRMCSVLGGVVSGNSFDEESWYSLYECSKGTITSSVGRIAYPELKGLSRDFILSVALSSVYAANPIGDRLCVANVASATISFAEVNHGRLNEIKRLNFFPPKILNKKKGNAFSAESIDCFNDICGTEEKVFLLYSGRKLQNSTVPGYECNHLITYSWNGEPIEHYYLEHSVSSISYDSGYIYCTSDYPSSMIFIYSIPSDY